MIDDRTEVEVDGEVMTLGEWTARLDKLEATETPFEREQRLFASAVRSLQKAGELMGWTSAEIDAYLMDGWRGDFFDGGPRLGKPVVDTNSRSKLNPNPPFGGFFIEEIG